MKPITVHVALVLGLLVPQAVIAETMPPSVEESQAEPVIYVGERTPNPFFYDGKFL